MGKQKGRKGKNSGEKGMHNKNSKNNRIIKIKTDFFNNYMIKLLKVYSTNKKYVLKNYIQVLHII